VAVQPLPREAPISEAPTPASAPRVIIGLPQFAAGLLALLAFAAVFTAPADFDYWWHLADGRFIATLHRLPVPDPFSFTASGRTWTAHEWLVELIMYRLHAAYGTAGPAAFFAACSAATMLVVLAVLRRIGARWPAALGVGFLLLLALLPYRGPRPFMVALLLNAAVWWLVEGWAGREGRRIWLLPPVMLLWANVNASLAIGLAVPAALLAGDLLARALGAPGRARLSPRGLGRLAIALALSIAATLLNPNGPRIWLLPLTTLRDPLHKYVIEWQPVSIGDPSLWAFVLLAGGLVALAMLRRPRLPLSDLLLAGALLAGGMASVRTAGMASIGLAMLVGRVLALPDGSGLRPPRRLAGVVAWQRRLAARYATPTPAAQAMTGGALAALALVGALALKPYDPAHDARLPVAAVRALGTDCVQAADTAQGPAGDCLAGPLFHPFDWGGYLIWTLWPRTRVFVDGRENDLYSGRGREFEQYIHITRLQPDAEELLDRHGIRTVLFEKDTPFVRYLALTGRWDITWDDGTVVRLDRRP